LRFFLSVIVGGVLGIGVSWITNSVLLEVSVSNFFSFCKRECINSALVLKDRDCKLSHY